MCYINTVIHSSFETLECSRGPGVLIWAEWLMMNVKRPWVCHLCDTTDAQNITSESILPEKQNAKISSCTRSHRSQRHGCQRETVLIIPSAKAASPLIFSSERAYHTTDHLSSLFVFVSDGEVQVWASRRCAGERSAAMCTCEGVKALRLKLLLTFKTVTSSVHLGSRLIRY